MVEFIKSVAPVFVAGAVGVVLILILKRKSKSDDKAETFMAEGILIIKARHLAVELRKEQRHKAISQALICNLPIGIIVTNEDGQITTINQLAREYLNVTINFARGRLLSDIAANLARDNLLKKGLNGIRFRCQQNRLVSKGQDIGVITTLYVDNAKHIEKVTPGTTSGAARWKETLPHLQKWSRNWWNSSLIAISG